MEVVCRRIQAIVDAYANPNRPSWENAKLFTGQGTPEDIVSPTFKTYAAKKNKDELELLQARQKVRELRTTHAHRLTKLKLEMVCPASPISPLRRKVGVKGLEGRWKVKCMMSWPSEPWGEPAEQPSYKAFGQQLGPSAGQSRKERSLFPLPFLHALSEMPDVLVELVGWSRSHWCFTLPPSLCSGKLWCVWMVWCIARSPVAS